MDPINIDAQFFRTARIDRSLVGYRNGTLVLDLQSASINHHLLIHRVVRAALLPEDQTLREVSILAGIVDELFQQCLASLESVPGELWGIGIGVPGP